MALSLLAEMNDRAVLDDGMGRRGRGRKGTGLQTMRYESQLLRKCQIDKSHYKTTTV
jgi:hypothetical protein